MAKCVEDLDALFEEAWNRIPYYYGGQHSDDFTNSLSDGQSTLHAKDTNKVLTEQNARVEEASSGKAVTEVNKRNRSQTTLQGVIDTRSSIRDTYTSSSPHETDNSAFSDSRTDGTCVKVVCTGVQDLHEIKEEFDIFEVKNESENDMDDFYAEQHHVLGVTANMSKSVDQHHMPSEAGTTSRTHLARANKHPDVNGVGPRTPTDVCREKGSAVQDQRDIESNLTASSHLNDDHGSIHFYEGLKMYQSRGMYTDVCIDKVRDKVERVIIDRCLHYRCKLCLKTISELVPTIKHARLHARGNYFFCDQCGRKFKCKFSYDIHLEFHAQELWREVPGPGSRLYACSMCHKFFPTNALLAFHRMTHTEELPYRCGVCDKRFRASKQREVHENTHQRVKRKLACSVCGKELSSPSMLALHLRRSHKYYKADIEAHACDKCPETFVSGTKLIAHMKTRHPPRPFSETCEKCGRNFSHPSILQQHQRACYAQQPATFPCKVCGKEFGRKELVYRHIKIHSNARPFKCRHCEMTFKHSDSRHRHELLHFKEGEFRDVKRHTWKVSHGKDGRQLR